MEWKNDCVCILFPFLFIRPAVLQQFFTNDTINKSTEQLL